MYDDHHEEITTPAPGGFKSGYNCVSGHGLIDDPKHNPPAPLPFAPAWRDQPAEPSAVVVTNGRYFSDALDSANIGLGHDYYHWGSVGECMIHAYRAVYGPDGTKTPVARMPECQTAFIAVAKAHINQWLDNTRQHTAENRQRYRGLIQDLTWVRKGDLKP